MSYTFIATQDHIVRADNYGRTWILLKLEAIYTWVPIKDAGEESK